VRHMVRDACDVFRANASAKGVELHVDTDGMPRSATHLRGDEEKLRQILINLISNARQSVVEADRADKRITVRSRRIGEARIRIEIEDNGLGIAPEHHARVFTHGFTTKAAGHGIGLHSSALAASELHGALTFASDGPDRGATFALELPLVPV